LPIARTAEIVTPMCDVLEHAHAAGIVHRDIKPDNVFLHSNGGAEIVKVVDFGIAKLLDVEEHDVAEATQLGAVIGTPSYIAPERLLGRSYDERSDIYSVGVVTYLMLTGSLPFHEVTPPSIGEMVKLHLTEKPQALPNVPEVVMRALDMEPGRRPALREIANALSS